MGKGLSDEQKACWAEQGYVAPVDVIGVDQAVACRAELAQAEAIIAANGWSRALAYKAHVVLPTRSRT